MCARTNKQNGTNTPLTPAEVQLTPLSAHFVAKALAGSRPGLRSHVMQAPGSQPCKSHAIDCLSRSSAIAAHSDRSHCTLGPGAMPARCPGCTGIAGRGFVLLMLATAISALFIRRLQSCPTGAGFTPIHLLIPVTLGGLALSFWHLAHRRIAQHRSVMRKLYFSSCVLLGCSRCFRAACSAICCAAIGLIPPLIPRSTREKHEPDL